MIRDGAFWAFFIIACIFVVFTLIESYSLTSVIYAAMLIVLGIGKLSGEIRSKRTLKKFEIKVKRKILDELKD